MQISYRPVEHADFLIVGAGIAGASIGHWLSPHARVVVLEGESQPGYHSTGRSAAVYMASYGTPQVRALTTASLAFFKAAAPGFSEQPVLADRGALIVASPGQEEDLESHWGMINGVAENAARLTARQACAMVSAIRSDKVVGAVYELDAFDMDVHAIHQGYLRGIRRAGGSVVCNASVRAMARTASTWQVRAGDTDYEAPVVINAAGAWADKVAGLAGVRPLGLQPRRRSAFMFEPPPGVAITHWPLTISAAEDWYFKPDAGLLLGSPANAEPVEPQDVQPEEIDIATGVHRIEEMTTLTIRRPTRTWAGLRSFVADGGLVGGFDTGVSGFFWVAAQGGYGIQTSPAMGEACAALARGEPMPSHLAALGLTAAMLAPGRLAALAPA